MARIQTFERDLRLATADIEPQNIAPELARFARQSLSEAIQSGEGTENYTKYVNGREGAAEETVVSPGPIVYDFIWWREIVEFAIQSAVERSPERSGDYKKSWFIMTPGGVVKSWDALSINDTVILTNNQPYHRKIDVGHMQMSVPPGVVEDVRRMVLGRFGNIITAKRTLIPLPGGYVLKGVFRRGYRPYARTKLRPDTQAGARMTYPALVMSMKDLG